MSFEEEDTLKVFLVDLGSCECVPANGVTSLEERFSQLPPQAFQACLATDQAQDRFKPTRGQIEAFADCVSGKCLGVKVVRVTLGLLHVQLFFMNGEDLCSVSLCAFSCEGF